MTEDDLREIETMLNGGWALSDQEMLIFLKNDVRRMITTIRKHNFNKLLELEIELKKGKE